MSKINTPARAVADLVDGCIVASVELATTPERVFLALASPEIIDWWVNPGVFDTREWIADVRVGGQWRASGIARGHPYALEGEFLEVDPPRKLVAYGRGARHAIDGDLRFAADHRGHAPYSASLGHCRAGSAK